MAELLMRVLAQAGRSVGDGQGAGERGWRKGRVTLGDIGRAGPWAGGWWLCSESSLTCPHYFFSLAHWHLGEMRNHFHIVMNKTPLWAQNMGGKGRTVVLANAGFSLALHLESLGAATAAAKPLQGAEHAAGRALSFRG